MPCGVASLQRDHGRGHGRQFEPQRESASRVCFTAATSLDVGRQRVVSRRTKLIDPCYIQLSSARDV